MDFLYYSLTHFKAGIDYLPRVYQVVSDKYGTVKLRNVLNGNELFHMRPDEIIINGLPSNIVQLQDLVFNSSCVCDGDEVDYGDEFKIFDLSFDETFE